MLNKIDRVPGVIAVII